MMFRIEPHRKKSVRDTQRDSSIRHQNSSIGKWITLATSMRALLMTCLLDVFSFSVYLLLSLRSCLSISSSLESNVIFSSHKSARKLSASYLKWNEKKQTQLIVILMMLANWVRNSMTQGHFVALFGIVSREKAVSIISQIDSTALASLPMNVKSVLNILNLDLGTCSHLTRNAVYKR